MRSLSLAAALAVPLALAGCARVSVDPIEIKPIHITMDITVRVDRDLDEFFAFEDKVQPGNGPATVPATQSAEAH